ELPPLEFSAPLQHKIDLSNVSTEVEEVIKNITSDLKTQVKFFKKRVVEDYENFPEYSIISNFKKFDGYKYYVKQHFENSGDHTKGDDDITDHVLKIVEKNLGRIESGKQLRQKLELNEIKLKELVTNNPILRRKKHIDSRYLQKIKITRTNLDRKTLQSIMRVEKILE